MADVHIEGMPSAGAAWAAGFGMERSAKANASGTSAGRSVQATPAAGASVLRSGAGSRVAPKPSASVNADGETVAPAPESTTACSTAAAEDVGAQANSTALTKKCRARIAALQKRIRHIVSRAPRARPCGCGRPLSREGTMIYRGASRIAPSRRITSPLSMSFSMMCCTSLA